MSTIKVMFEIGHEASIRTKKTPEGFTHDWEVFVKGVDNADISLFVDKVVFQLHETFPKPKRVVKEPPYSVRESGYAGFNFPIEIYFKNKDRDEPKKVIFNYDLHLQQSGPPISKVMKESHVFHNPSDDFKRKLLKGGGFLVATTNLFNAHLNIDPERSRDSYTEEKPQQLIGKPKLSGDSIKKHKSKDHRIDDLPRPSNSFVNLFGPPIHKTSRISPDPKKPSPNPKIDKKEKLYVEKDKSKIKHDSKEKDENKYKEDKVKSIKEDKDKSKEEKKSKSHKDRDSLKDKSSKRPAERPPSPGPPPKKSGPPPLSPKPNLPPAVKEETKPNKYLEAEIKNKPIKVESRDQEKKVKKDKKSHEKDGEGKKEHKRDKEMKTVNSEKEIKVKEVPAKDILKHQEKKIDKPFNKFSIDNMLKDPTESKHREGSKHKDKSDKERKHKHKKKDKKRDEPREKSKESSSKEKKHRHEKHSHKEKYSEIKEMVVEKSDPVPACREIDKSSSSSKLYKEKDRSQLTISPISVDTSSQSSSKSINKKTIINNKSVRIETHSCSSNSESEASIVSEDENVSVNSESNSKTSKQSTKLISEPPKQETLKIDKSAIEKGSSPSTSHKSKNKDKSSKHEGKSDKKSKKRKVETDDVEIVSKAPKIAEDEKTKRVENINLLSDNVRVKPESSPRVKTDTKVQDDGVSSSLSDHPMKCDSPLSEDTSQVEPNRKQISPDYMLQLKELQQRIMTLQSNDELDRVVNLIAETGKYEVTKKTFDFDLCLLDRSTVQQLQELIGCESRA